MTIDRAGALRNAETFIRQGKFDHAIAEYLRLVDDRPEDWTSANALGDLYVRHAQSDKAIAQFTRIADAFHERGFLSRAAALYKKILKIAPDDEHALLQAAEIAVGQGLLVDARGYLTTVATIRRTRGDATGADAMAVRLGALDSSAEAARLSGAPALRERRGGSDAIVVPNGVADTLVIEAPIATGTFDLSADATVSGSRAVARHAAAPPAELVALPVQVSRLVDVGRGGSEVDLSVVLDEMHTLVPLPESPVDLDDVFAGLREQARRRLASEAAEQFRKGVALFQAGQIDECIPALEAAARAPHFRFDASAVLGRIFLRRGLLTEAIEWLDRAADAPARTAADGHAVLYDLAEALESTGETARALAVYLQLQADAGPFRDVAERVERLGGPGTRG